MFPNHILFVFFSTFILFYFIHYHHHDYHIVFWFVENNLSKCWAYENEFLSKLPIQSLNFMVQRFRFFSASVHNHCTAPLSKRGGSWNHVLFCRKDNVLFLSVPGNGGHVSLYREPKYIVHYICSIHMIKGIFYKKKRRLSQQTTLVFVLFPDSVLSAWHIPHVEWR